MLGDSGKVSIQVQLQKSNTLVTCLKGSILLSSGASVRAHYGSQGKKPNNTFIVRKLILEIVTQMKLNFTSS